MVVFILSFIIIKISLFLYDLSNDSNSSFLIKLHVFFLSFKIKKPPNKIDRNINLGTRKLSRYFGILPNTKNKDGNDEKYIKSRALFLSIFP